MEPFSTLCRELFTLPGALPAQALQPPLSLSFLQVQLLKQFLQKLAFRKDEQGFYLSCTAVTSHYVGKPERGLWLLRVSWGGKCGHAKQTTRSGYLQGQKPCRETRSSIRFGETTHIFLKLGLFSHKMELWLCAFQRRVDASNAGCSCRVVNLCHKTLLPCKERREATRPWQ